jgi:hypothetical protein
VEPEVAAEPLPIWEQQQLQPMMQIPVAGGLLSFLFFSFQPGFLNRLLQAERQKEGQEHA